VGLIIMGFRAAAVLAAARVYQVPAIPALVSSGQQMRR